MSNSLRRYGSQHHVTGVKKNDRLCLPAMSSVNQESFFSSLPMESLDWLLIDRKESNHSINGDNAAKTDMNQYL